MGVRSHCGSCLLITAVQSGVWTGPQSNSWVVLWNDSTILGYAYGCITCIWRCQALEKTLVCQWPKSMRPPVNKLHCSSLGLIRHAQSHLWSGFAKQPELNRERALRSFFDGGFFQRPRWQWPQPGGCNCRKGCPGRHW